MNAIECMMQEHQNILRMLAVVRKACYGVMVGKQICYEDFADMISFIRNYADRHHHGKEEDILFLEMKQRLGAMGQKLITNGMLVEHDYGRLYIKQLETALGQVQAGDDSARLDVIANAIGYTNLLARHIEKEDSVVYPFGAKKLEADVMNMIEANCEVVERKAEELGLQNKYLALLDRLEKKYL